jgi:hypothetical protein
MLGGAVDDEWVREARAASPKVDVDEAASSVLRLDDANGRLESSSAVTGFRYLPAIVTANPAVGIWRQTVHDPGCVDRVLRVRARAGEDGQPTMLSAVAIDVTGAAVIVDHDQALRERRAGPAHALSTSTP